MISGMSTRSGPLGAVPGEAPAIIEERLESTFMPGQEKNGIVALLSNLSVEATVDRLRKLLMRKESLCSRSSITGAKPKKSA